MIPSTASRTLAAFTLASLAAFSTPIQATATTFTDVGAALTGVRESAVAWGDYDNDGDLDFVLSGFTGSVGVAKLYRNSGGPIPTFSDAGAGFTPVRGPALAWGDFDSDGDLDLLMTGFAATGPVTKLYRNDGGPDPTFTDLPEPFVAVQVGSVAWGDYDNDGDLDILITGSDVNFVPTTRLYRNSGGNNPTFTDVGAALDNVQQSSVAWGDYDKDGDLDILLTGFMTGGRVAKVYRNSGGANPTFSDAAVGLTAVELSSVAWGDDDNDGDLDILLTGYNGSARIAKVYRNNGGANPTFTDVGAALDGVNSSSVAWGDYDNDGDFDILLTGFTGTTRITKLYQSSGGASPTFSEAAAGLVNVQSSSVAWGDYDNDGDLDVLITGYDPGNIPTSKLYRNDATPANALPTAPGSLSATTNASGTTFTWTASSDAQTPAAGLTYNLRVGTTSGGTDVSSPLAAANGYRRVARLGGANHDLSWRLQLPPGIYYWSVQAVDGAFAGSAFAAENSFAIKAFTDISAGLLGVQDGSVSWGDYDGDLDLDILVTGSNAGTLISKVYRNDFGTFTDIGAGLAGVGFSSAAWGDYDNDGDLDILLTGVNASNQTVSKVYRNDGGSFTDIGAALTAVEASAVSWGDYDNDGDLDILLTGLTATDVTGVRVARLYRNEGSGSFTDVGAALPGVSQGSVAWGDYDSDGDLDILIAGIDSGDNRICNVYRNDGSGSFIQIAFPILGLSSCSVAWGDYDADGDLDILVAGNQSTGANPTTLVLRNDGGGVFVQLVQPSLTGVFWCSVAWGDYDNDGDLDILLAGINSSSTAISRVYRNEGGGSFVDIVANLTAVGHASVAWGDFDRDGDLDILLSGSGMTKVYRSGGQPGNAAPIGPGSLSATRNGSQVTFSWANPGDDHTPDPGLSFNLRVGTTPGGNQIMPAMADDATGIRRVPRLGNVQNRTSWTLTIPPGPYYWSVQAIDGAFLGSAFSTSTVAVEQTAEATSTIELEAPVPNPFATDVALSFALPQKSRVSVAVFDLQGRRVRVLAHGERPAGHHRVRWDGRDESGARERNGVYLVRMSTAGSSWTRKVVLAR